MKTFIFCALFAFILCSCGTSHQIETKGKTTVITNDTTVIYHGGNSKLTVTTPVR